MKKIILTSFVTVALITASYFIYVFNTKNLYAAEWSCAGMKMECGTTHPYTLICKRGELLKQVNPSQGINNELEFVTYNQVQDTWMYVDKSDEYNKTFHILKYFDEEDAVVIRNWSWLYRKSKRESFDEAINEDIFVENICSQTKK